MTTNKLPRLTLISHNLCPYVQRAAIALEEMGIEYRRIDIDLETPPDWFRRLSPLGRVPLLRIDDDGLLFESAVIAEYVNELGQGEFLAKSPFERARQRSWIEFASAMLDNIGALYNASGDESFEEVAMQLDGKWIQLEEVLADAGFFGGDSFSLVDAAFAPVFRYIDLFEQIIDRPLIDDLPRVSAWRLQLANRPSVIKVVREDYPRLLLQFVARRNSWLGERARDRLGQVAA